MLQGGDKDVTKAIIKDTNEGKNFPDEDDGASAALSWQPVRV